MTTAAERLSKILVKVRRAQKHADELDHVLRAFLDSNPFKIDVRRDSTTQQPVYFLSSVQEPPWELAAITGDILFDLRSALDHLAHCLVEVGTGQSGPFPHVSFPISDSDADYATLKVRRTSGMRPDAIQEIDTLKPYQGGNDILWILHRLNNVDKHRLLVTVGASYRSVGAIGALLRRFIQERGLEGFPDDDPMFNLGLRAADRQFPLKAGNILFMDAPNAPFDSKINFEFEVAIGEPNVLDGAPLRATLHDMIKVVSDIISNFESHLA